MNMAFIIRRAFQTRNCKKALSVFQKTLYSTDTSHILYSDLPKIDVPNVTIQEDLLKNVHKWPQKIAAECAVTGRSYTYEEIERFASNLSKNLRKKLKLQKGDVIGLLLSNCPEFFLVTLGALQAGLIITTLNPLYTSNEISRQLVDSNTRALITLHDLFPLAKSSTISGQNSIPIITIKTQKDQSPPNGAINFEEFLENLDYPEIPQGDSRDIAILPYSSGTTGLPKGVYLSHGNIVSNFHQYAQKEITVLRYASNDHQDVLPVVLPQFHIYGLVATTFHLFRHGCKSVTLPKFTPELYLDVLRRHKPDVLFVVPPIVLFLSSHPAVTSTDLESIRSVVCGAAPLGSLDEERFLKKAQRDIEINQGFGLTETSPMLCMSTKNHRSLPNSGSTIGRPVALTCCKIVNPDDPKGTPLGPNQKGELLVKGPQVMQGYHNRPEETKQVFTEDGWFKTGDLLYYDDNKLLYVSDRLKELIKVKGYQVAPAELEEIIRDFPNVEDAAVVGIPHPVQGEIPRAFIVEKKGSNVDGQKLQAFVAEKVAPYKKLGDVMIVGSIPKNASGKILRRVLKEQFAS